MKKLTILVDMDDVLENLVECWLAEIELRFGISIPIEDIKTWDIASFFPTLTKEQVFSPLSDDEFWDKLTPLLGASECLSILINDGHTVRIVTASYYETLPAKMKWLFKHYPFLKWEDVIVAYDKKIINGDVLIDDGIHNLEGAPYKKILFSRPYNIDYDAESNGMVRVRSWIDIYREILKIS